MSNEVNKTFLNSVIFEKCDFAGNYFTNFGGYF